MLHCWRCRGKRTRPEYDRQQQHHRGGGALYANKTGIVGTNAGDLIAEVGLAIEMGTDASDVGLTAHSSSNVIVHTLACPCASIADARRIQIAGNQVTGNHIIVRRTGLYHDSMALQVGLYVYRCEVTAGPADIVRNDKIRYASLDHDARISSRRAVH